MHRSTCGLSQLDATPARVLVSDEARAAAVADVSFSIRSPELHCAVLLAVAMTVTGFAMAE